MSSSILPPHHKKILIVDDKKNILTVLETFLTGLGYQVRTAQGGKDGYRVAMVFDPDLILCDIRMGDIDGLQLAGMLRAQGVEKKFVFITAFASVQGAVEAIKAGGFDYLTKPLDYQGLKEVIRQALLEKPVAAPKRRIIGSSEAMRSIFQRISAVAATNSTVLIIGESGTGKELIARAIHDQSRRHSGPFVPVHCASFNENLLEAELFGFERGSFTGATHRKTGFFEVADQGTLFLDEISEVSPATQVSLLRVLQERTFTRVGGTEFIKVDVRVIAATNRDLLDLVREKLFREDLYYRINVVPIVVPPLRHRVSDISELTREFVRSVCVNEQIGKIPEIAPEALHELEAYDWPGNVRELQNIIERILVIHKPAEITREMVAAETGIARRAGQDQKSWTEERSLLIDALRRTGGNKTEAASLLRLSRRTLYNRITRLRIDSAEYS